MTKQTFEMHKCRLNGHLRAYLGNVDVSNINHKKYLIHLVFIGAKDWRSCSQSISRLAKKVLYKGIIDGIVKQMPISRKSKSKIIPRDSFLVHEYKKLLRISKQLLSLKEVMGI
jgi:hypothetical protein